MERLLTIIAFEHFVVFAICMLVGTAIVVGKTIANSNTIGSRKRKAIRILLTIVLALITSVLVYTNVDLLTQIPTFEETIPKDIRSWNANNTEITVYFRTPVDVRTVQIHTYPENAFTIKKLGYLGNRLPWARAVTLTPLVTIPPGEQLMVYFTKLNGVIPQAHGGEHLLEVRAQMPEITVVSPAPDTEPISASQSILVDLDTVSGFESEWKVNSNPTHDFLITQHSPQQLTITPSSPLKQATNYTLDLIQTPVVLRKNDGEVLSKGMPLLKRTLTYTTVNPPFINALTPQGSEVSPYDDIEIVFTQNMNTSSVEESLIISPEIDFTPVWNASGSALRIQHPMLEKHTQYSITLAKGLKTTDGGTLEKPIQFSFTTAGPLQLTNTTQIEENTAISINNPIELVFNQPITTETLASLSISPSIIGSRTISDTKLVITPETILPFDTLYTVTMRAGTSGVYGLPSTEDQIFSFITQPNETVLAVPYFKQQESFTCNIAAARMLLAYRGVTLSEKEIIARVGNGGKRGRGNPNLGYIDDYGTYWDAIIQGVRPYRPYRLLKSGILSEIIEEIQHQNPVMIWGQNGWSDPHDISWTTPEGTFIKAINGMHSSVVRGFRGPADNPTHILLNDPWRGQYAIETSEFMRRWGYLGVALVLD